MTRKQLLAVVFLVFSAIGVILSLYLMFTGRLESEPIVPMLFLIVGAFFAVASRDKGINAELEELKRLKNIKRKP